MRSDARGLHFRKVRRTRSHVNVFTRGGERDRTRSRTRSHEEIAHGRKRVHTRRQTRSHAVANAFTRGGERNRTRLRTRSRYTLYTGGTVALFSTASTCCSWTLRRAQRKEPLFTDSERRYFTPRDRGRQQEDAA